MSFSPPIPPKQVSPARGWEACFFVIGEEGERQIWVYPQWRYSTKPETGWRSGVFDTRLYAIDSICAAQSCQRRVIAHSVMMANVKYFNLLVW